jgi:hypothetical protein
VIIYLFKNSRISLVCQEGKGEKLKSKEEEKNEYDFFMFQLSPASEAGFKANESKI